MSSVFKTTIAATPVTTHFKKLTTGNNVFIFSVIVQSNSHAAVLTSNVQFVRLAVGRPTKAGDATDQWRNR